MQKMMGAKGTIVLGVLPAVNVSNGKEGSWTKEKILSGTIMSLFYLFFNFLLNIGSYIKVEYYASFFGSVWFFFLSGRKKLSRVTFGEMIFYFCTKLLFLCYCGTENYPFFSAPWKKEIESGKNWALFNMFAHGYHYRVCLRPTPGRSHPCGNTAHTPDAAEARLCADLSYVYPE